MKGPPSCGQVFRTGNSRQIDVCTALDDLLARSVFRGDHLGEEVAYFGQHWQHLHLVEQAGWGLRFEESADSIGYVVEGVGFQASCMRRRLPKLVHQDARARVAFYVFEEERRSPGICGATAELGDAVGYFGHFEVG